MTTNEIVGRLKNGGLDASSTNRSAAVYVTEARSGRAEPGWFGFRIVCDGEATERRVRAILSRWYDIDRNGNVWRLRAKNRVPLMAIKRGGTPPTPPTPTGDYMYFEAVQPNSTVSMMSQLETAPNLEYSTDGETWQEWPHTTAEGTHTFDTITLSAIGDKVYLRGINPNGLGVSEEELSFFTFTGLLNSGGCMMSLLDGTGEGDTIPDYGFVFLFGGNMNLYWSGLSQICYAPLLTLPDLSKIVTIGEFGLAGTFMGCQLCQEPADLPSLVHTSLGALANTYDACISLERAADMPNLDLIEFLTSGGAGDWMYGFCTFPFSNDGVTLNFEFPDFSSITGMTAEQIAYSLGTPIGFGYGEAFVAYNPHTTDTAYIGEGGSSSVFFLYFAPEYIGLIPYYQESIQFTNGEYSDTLTAKIADGHTFVKWQKWNGTNWVDLSTDNPDAFTLTEQETVGYYRPVAE